MTDKPKGDQTSGDDEGFETGLELWERLPNEPHHAAPAPAPAPAPRSRVRLLLAALLTVVVVVIVLYLIMR
jgi:hypothetical protein